MCLLPSRQPPLCFVASQTELLPITWRSGSSAHLWLTAEPSDFKDKAGHIPYFSVREPGSQHFQTSLPCLWHKPLCSCCGDVKQFAQVTNTGFHYLFIYFFIKGLPTSRNTVFTVLNCAVEPAVLKLEQTVWDYFQWRINPHLALWWLFAEAGVLWTQLKMNHDAHVHRDDGTHLEAAR